MRYSKKVLKVFSGIFVLTSISLIFYYIFPVVFAAWVGPTAAPPGGNVDIVDTCSGIFGDWCGELDYTGQADVVYDDYRKNADSGYTRPLLSTWTQTSASPEIWKDERTGLYWSDQQGTATTNSFTIATCDFYSMARGAYTGGDTDCGNAINRCADLNGTTHGGRTGWYLPSQHELMQAYLDGMYIQTSHSFTTVSRFWSSSEVSYSSMIAWGVNLAYGHVYDIFFKPENYGVRCVSDDQITVTADVDPAEGCSTMDLGDECGGGKVAHKNGIGGGFVAAIADNSTGVEWGCEGTLVGASGEAIGTGFINTSAILSGCATRPIAASVCDAYDGGGYTDWFLPSKYELNQLYLNSVAIGGFENVIYWSSTEYGTNDAWYQYFGNGYQIYSYKSSIDRVRCIRAF